MRSILSTLRARSVAATVLTPPYIDAASFPELAERSERLERMVGRLRRIAAEEQAVVADAYAAMKRHVDGGGEKLHWGDGVHPNARGLRVMAGELQKAWGFGKPLVEPVVADPEPGPAPEPEPKPAPEPAPRPAPRTPSVSPKPSTVTKVNRFGWKRIFDGRNFGNWKRISGKAVLKDGAIVAGRNVDLLYKAGWRSFGFGMTVKATASSGVHLFAVSLGHTGSGRGGGRLLLTFYKDGDCHLKIDGKRAWKAGERSYTMDGWRQLVFIVTDDRLQIFADGKLRDNVDVSAAAPKSGGVLLYTYAGSTVEFRDIVAKYR
jgi:hypothetical protein